MGNTKRQRKVIYVEFYQPVNGKKHYYFGSQAAIYDIFSRAEIGISKGALWKVLSKNNEYYGKKAIIREGILITKKTNRGKKE